MMWMIIVIIILVLLMILVLKMTKKYHITWYWCQNIRDNMVEKRVKKFGQGPPPLFGQCPKEIDFSYVRSSLMPINDWRFKMAMWILLIWVRFRPSCPLPNNEKNFCRFKVDFAAESCSDLEGGRKTHRLVHFPEERRSDRCRYL